MFLPRRVLMGYEPFQSHRGEKEREKNGCLGNKADQSAAYTLSPDHLIYSVNAG